MCLNWSLSSVDFMDGRYTLYNYTVSEWDTFMYFMDVPETIDFTTKLLYIPRRTALVIMIYVSCLLGRSAENLDPPQDDPVLTLDYEHLERSGQVRSGQ